MQFTNTRQQVISDYLESRPFEEVAQLQNEYLGGDDYIFFSIEETVEKAPDNDPLWLARAIFFGKVENWGDAVKFNGYDNLESVWSVDHLEIDRLAEILDENNVYQLEAVGLFDGVLEFAVLADDEKEAIELLLDDVEDDAELTSVYWRMA